MDKNNPKINLDDYKRMDYPKRMYKHYSLSSNSVNALSGKENPYLYFSHPNQLNDIVDGSMVLWDLKNLDRYFYSLILQGIWKHFGKSNKDFIEEFNDKLTSMYEEAKKSNFEDIKLGLSFLNFYQRGILSLTENCCNNLMWAHYSYDDGFVLELDVDSLLEKLKNQVSEIYIFPINYKKKLYPIDFSKYIRFDEEKKELIMVEPLLYYVSTKYKDWKYEREWRVVIDKNNLGHSLNKLDFDTKKLRDKIFEQKTETKQDIFDAESRKIEIETNTITKIILGPYFFNNLYFSAIREENEQVFFLFKQSTQISEIDFQKLKYFLVFLNAVKKDFGDKIEQVEVKNVVNNGIVSLKRKVCYKIKIIKLDDSLLVIEKTAIEDIS